ncbi:hypothetical protein ACTID9_00735 [Brevibacillus fluminis]|uniref:hypothetical protein n=1 Tax=Brevibacillus fluminis TaxID=511487 RepID=UPI003F8CC1EE
MYQQVQRFVSAFRELEKKEFELSTEQQESWKQLKEKLASPSDSDVDESPHRGLQTIVVTGLYPRTGSSFIASNYAYYHSGKSVTTTLCELPGIFSSYYISLDFEKRASGSEQTNKTLLLQGRKLRIHAQQPRQVEHSNHTDTMSWFYPLLKSTQLLVVDISSHWNSATAAWLMGLADQIWVVVDTDFPRLAQTVFDEPTPSWWLTETSKIRIILNKWPLNSSKGSVWRKVQGTLAIWDERVSIPSVFCCVPPMDEEAVLKTRLAARLYLEMYPNEKELIDQLACLDKGRFL